jgi:hypothetical protein
MHILRLFLLAIILFLYGNIFAHPMGMSMSKLVYDKGTLTLTTRIFYGDFYFEFQKWASVKNKNYPKQGFDKSDVADLNKYFRAHIKIWIDGKEISLTITKQSLENHEDDAFILVVELKGKAKIRPNSVIKVRNTVLVEEITSQQNMINFYLNDSSMPSHSLVTLDKKKPEHEFKAK